MQPQKPGFKILKKFSFRATLLIFGSIALLSVSCKNDIEIINALAMGPDKPTMTYTNASFEYTDSAKLQARLFAETVQYFMDSPEPYYEFPKGIDIVFFDENNVKSSKITANYAIWKEDEEIFEARDSVVARDLKQHQVVESEQMFWDRKKQLIYSEVFTKITNEDGVHFGEKGFEASQDLSYYRLIGSKGKVKMKDEE